MTQPARGGIILLGRLGVMTGLNYGFGLTLAWLLVPSDFGRVAVLQAVLLSGAMIVHSGFPWVVAWSAAARETLGGAQVRSVVRLSLVGNVGIGLALGLMILALHASAVLPLGSPMTALIAAFTLPVFAVHSVLRGWLHGSLRFGRLAVAQMIEVATKIGVSVGLVVLIGSASEPVAIGFLVGALVATAIAGWGLADVISGSTASHRASDAFSGTGYIFVGTFGLALFTTVDILVLRTQVSPSIVAVYQVAIMLSRAPYLLGDAVMDAAFPYMARRHSSPEISHAWFVAALRWILIVVLPLEVAIGIAPTPILALIFPSEYAGAVTAVRILALGSVGALGALLSFKALQALRLRRPAAIGALVALATELMLLALLVPAWEETGAAAASAISAWIGFAVLSVAYLLNVRPALVYSRATVKYGLAFACFVAPALVADRYPGWTGVMWLSVAAGTYAAAIMALRLIGLDDVRRVVAGLAGERSTGQRTPS